MPAARYWRVVGIRPYGGGDLELSELHLYGAGGRLDASATLTCSYAPASGTLAALKDGNTATDCRFSSASIKSASFALGWDFGAGGTADVWGIRAAASADAGAFLSMCDLQYFTGTTWATTNLGRHMFPGARAYSATPTQVPDFLTPRDTWLQRTVAGTDWTWCACSADGLVQAAADSTRYYTTANGGDTWTARSTGSFYAGAVSGDGGTILTAIYGGAIYRSLDGGATRTTLSAAGSRNWSAVACSANGSVIAAVADNGGAYVSLNAGTSFTRYATTQVFTAVAMSADGTKMVAGNGVGASDLFMSLDSGATWSTRAGAGSRSWVAVAITPDGQRVYAGINGGGIMHSADGGTVWAVLPGASAKTWVAVAASTDGVTVMAVALAGFSFISEDSGATFTQMVTPLSAAAVHGCMSSDGRRRTLVVPTFSALYTFFRRQAIYAPALVATNPPAPHLVAASAPLADHTTVALRGPRSAFDAEFGGRGRVRNAVKEKGTPDTPVRRRVRLVRERDGVVVREQWSDPVTGAYDFQGVDERQTYTVLSYDHTLNMRAVIADGLTLANGTVELMP